MEQITLRIREDTLESIDSEATEHDKSRSEHMRDMLESHTEHGDPEELRQRVTELEGDLADVQAERDRLEAERDDLADEVADLEAELSDRPDADTVAELRDRIDDLQGEINSLEARNTDLTNQLAEANTRIDAANDLVEYVDDERSAQQRWREAGLLGKAKYTVFGMPTDDEGDGG